MRWFDCQRSKSDEPYFDIFPVNNESFGAKLTRRVFNILKTYKVHPEKNIH